MSDNLITDTTRLSTRLWLRLLTSTHIIESEIRSQLRESFDTTLPRFDVMAQLYRYGEGLRMGEISKLLMVTGGNITGIIDQLTHENLVKRVVDPNDRRAFIVKLTQKGVRHFEQMATVHHTWVESLLDGLTPDEQADLHDLLKKLRHSLEEKRNND